MLFKEIICIIPARKGSKGIKNKNLKKIKNKPLVQYSIDSAKKISNLAEICVSTDSTLIRKIALKNKIKFYGLRPAKLSGDYTETKDVVKYELLKYEKIYKRKFKYILLLQPTTPIRNVNLLRKIIRLIKNDKKIDSVISVKDVGGNHPLRMKIFKSGLLKNYSGKKKEDMRPRQKLPKVFIRSGSFYLISRSFFIKYISLVGKNCYGIILRGLESTNIDNILDLKYLEMKI